MNRTALTILFAALFQLNAAAQASSVILPTLEISHDAVSSAMAGAALLQDTNDASVSYQNWVPSSTSYINFGGQYTIAGRFKVKAGVNYGSGKAYDISDGLSSQIGKYSPSELTVSAGIGYKFTDFLGAEATAKYADGKTAPHAGISAFCADVLLKAWVKDFKFAIGVANAGPDVQGFKLPAAAAFAAGYDKTFEEAGEKHRIEAEVDIKYFLYGEVGASAGLAYTYNNIFTLRAGYHGGGIVGNHGSVGVGFKFKGIHIDGTYLAGGQIKNSFCIGLGYSF